MVVLAAENAKLLPLNKRWQIYHQIVRPLESLHFHLPAWTVLEDSLRDKANLEKCAWTTAINKKEIKKWNQARIHDFLVQHSVKWTFNPPAGSHHGGVWERCIRTVRKVMRAITKEQLLNDKSLNTLKCEVEAIVNGQPLTKLSDDPRDLKPLTPNHLLLLRSGSKLPPGIFTK